MTRPFFAVPLILVAPLAGCIPIPVPVGTPGSIQITEGDPCGAKKLQSFVGQGGDAVRGVNFEAPNPVRVLASGQDPGAPDPQRLTFRVDASDRIAAVECN